MPDPCDIYDLMDFGKKIIEKIKQTEQPSQIEEYKKVLNCLYKDIWDWQMIQTGRERPLEYRVGELQDQIMEQLKKQPDRPPESLQDRFKEKTEKYYKNREHEKDNDLDRER